LPLETPDRRQIEAHGRAPSTRNYMVKARRVRHCLCALRRRGDGPIKSRSPQNNGSETRRKRKPRGHSAHTHRTRPFCLSADVWRFHLPTQVWRFSPAMADWRHKLQPDVINSSSWRTMVYRFNNTCWCGKCRGDQITCRRIFIGVGSRSCRDISVGESIQQAERERRKGFAEFSVTLLGALWSVALLFQDGDACQTIACSVP